MPNFFRLFQAYFPEEQIDRENLEMDFWPIHARSAECQNLKPNIQT